MFYRWTQGLDVAGSCPRPITNKKIMQKNAQYFLMLIGCLDIFFFFEGMIEQGSDFKTPDDSVQGSLPHSLFVKHPWEWCWHLSRLFTQSLYPNKMSVELHPCIPSAWILIVWFSFSTTSLSSTYSYFLRTVFILFLSRIDPSLYLWLYSFLLTNIYWAVH